MSINYLFKKRYLLILLLIWIYKEYKFNKKIKINEHTFQTKRKNLYLSSLKLDDNNIQTVDMSDSEISNNKKIKNVFPFKEFMSFVANSTVEEIDITLSQLFYSSSLTHVDNKTLKNGLIYYICNDYYDDASTLSKNIINTYVNIIVCKLRNIIPYVDNQNNINNNIFFKTDLLHFPVYHSWLLCKLMEYAFKIGNMYTILKYSLQKFTENDVDIYYKLNGKKNIVLIFGGIIGNIGTISNFVHLLDKNYDIIYPVFPITNKSIDYKFENPENITEYLDSINNFLKIHNIKTIHILGWSFGGLLSHNFILNFPDYVIKSQFIIEGLGVPFSCITSTMLINESFINSFTRISNHIENKYFFALFAYCIIFKLKSIQWTSYILTTFRNIVWDTNFLDNENVTLYFSRHDFLLPINLHKNYISSFTKANIIIEDGNHGFYLMSTQFYSSLKHHFEKFI